MLSDLLDVTRTRLGGGLPIAPKAMDVSRTAKHVAAEAHAFHPTRTVVFTAIGDCRGTWDEIRVYQLLSNLVENAIRHGDAEKPVKVEAVGKADEVQIAVHNEGAPIPQSEMRRIFEPMKQAEAHHGAIDVESAKETGTTFTVYLPHQRAHRRSGAAESTVS